MEIIPVIDLKGGVVVRAALGERAAYRPIVTPLSRGSGAVEVVAGLLGLHPFRTLYIADLDAIEGIGDGRAEIAAIARAFPGLSLWIDAGMATGAAAEDMLARFPQASPVIGSESQRDGALRQYRHVLGQTILSLDFRGDVFLGPPALLDNPQCWPRRVIVMTLARVGSDAGPDLQRYRSIRERSSESAIYMAGGLRGPADLQALSACGAAGILVASALHDGRLAPADLAGR